MSFFVFRFFKKLPARVLPCSGAGGGWAGGCLTAKLGDYQEGKKSVTDHRYRGVVLSEEP